MFGRSKTQSGLIVFLLTIIGILLVILAGLTIWLKGFALAESQNYESEFFTTAIEGSIHEIGELATAEYGYIIAQTAEKPKKKIVGFEIPLTSGKVVYSYEGVVKAGVNFEKIKVNVSEAEKTIFVDMPDAEILSSDVDFDSLVVYDQKFSPFNAFTFEDMSLSVGGLKKTAENAALFNGLLDTAGNNAENIISGAIGSMYNHDEFIVKFH